MTDEGYPAEEIDRLMDDGLGALEEEQYEAAAELFRRVIQVAPFRHDARDYLAFALDQQFARESGRPQRRMKAGAVGLSSAAAASTDYSRPVRWRVPMWFMAGICAVALFALLVFVIAPRLNFAGWFGGLVRQSGETTKPGPASPLAAEFKKADSAVSRSQFDEALLILRRVKESSDTLGTTDRALLDKKIGEVYAAKGKALADKKNYDRALETAEQGLEFDPSSARLNFLVGLCSERKAIKAISEGKTNEARQHYQKAVKALDKSLDGDPENLDALELLASSYIKINRTADAIKTWNRIITIAPDSTQAERAKSYKASLGFSRE